MVESGSVVRVPGVSARVADRLVLRNFRNVAVRINGTSSSVKTPKKTTMCGRIQTFGMMMNAVAMRNIPVMAKMIAVVTPSRGDLHPKERIFIVWS